LTHPLGFQNVQRVLASLYASQRQQVVGQAVECNRPEIGSESAQHNRVVPQFLLLALHAAHARDRDDVAALNERIEQLYNKGRYSEAIPIAQRALAIREKALGPNHPLLSTTLNNLALLYDALGRYADAEPLYKRSLAISEKTLGSDHPNVAASLRNLAALYFDSSTLC
jgi:tetratricopeptide (TPR) repeat protein